MKYFLNVHIPRTDYGKRNILHDGANIYNDLTKQMKECTSLTMFKSQLKSFISENIYE